MIFCSKMFHVVYKRNIRQRLKNLGETYFAKNIRGRYIWESSKKMQNDDDGTFFDYFWSGGCGYVLLNLKGGKSIRGRW